jgi:rhodanese-related sulfurtransferase
MTVYNSIYYVLLIIPLYFIIKYGFNKNKEVIIDVRTKEEYNKRHIPESINIPYNIIDTIKVPKDTKIILYCNTGRRANISKNTLINLGYTNVKIYNYLSTTPTHF